MRLHVLLTLLILLLLGAVGCNATVPAAAPTALPAATESAIAPTAAPTAIAAAEASAVPVDPAAARSTLTTMLLESLTVSVPVTSGVGIEGAVAFPLETSADSPLWLAHTIGIRSFDPEQTHLIAIYRPAGDQWVAVARHELATSADPAASTSPDYLGEGGVSQVQIEPTHLWLQVEGGVGADSGVYGLFRFDGHALTQELGGFSASPGVGQVIDLNGDDRKEVLLDATDYYVFCYACGVREIRYEIWHWDGRAMVPVEWQPLGDAAPTAVRAFNQQLLALAAAGLWQDAQTLIPQAARFSYTEPALQWNLIDVQTNAAAREADAQSDSAYPLLSQLFYGDYAAAVAIMRAVGAADLFIPETPLIVGTVAEGWQTELADRLTATASAAIAVQPDLAAAYFVRGWGDYVRNFDMAAAVADVQMAAELAPDEALYRESLALLTE